MTSSIYTNTGIVESSWNSRGLILHNAVTKNLLVEDNGTLWAAVRENNPTKWINIYKSTDNGFSWENMYRGDFSTGTRRTGITNLNTNGPVMHLTYNEELKKLILWHSFYETDLGRFDIEPFIFNVTENGLTRPSSTGDNADPTVTEAISTDMDELFFDVSYSDNGIFLTYSQNSQLTCQFFRHSFQATPDGSIRNTIINDFFSLISTCSNNEDKINIVAIRDLSNQYQLVHLTYDRLSASFSATNIIQTIPVADIIDLNIERDGFGNLCVLWSEKTPDDLNIFEKYSISTNNGIDWSTPVTIPTTTAQGDLKDIATQQLTGRTVLIAGLQGFAISYCRLFENVGTGYVRLLLSTDGFSYTLEDEKVAVLPTDEPVTGIKFFRPIGTSLINLNNPGEIRIAYNLGESFSQTQVDKYPNYFGQKLLKDEAFLETTLIPFEEDEPLDNQLLASFNLLGGTSDNVDYYEEGLVGPLTDKYESAFERFGTTTYFERYEPISESYLGDKSAYELTNSSYVRVFFQETNYGFPVPSGNESFSEYIERDMRKVHLPPYFHIGRTFLINKGNKLKRTVWTLKFDGNEYEISQVVPKFVNNQIAYYTANAYVIGPSRNPFTRTILPSET
jgi:hypothetical protein